MDIIFAIKNGTAIKNSTAKVSLTLFTTTLITPLAPFQQPCFSLNLTTGQSDSQNSSSQVSYISSSLLQAGSETTANALVGFVQAILVFPDVQARAQEGLDRVVGPNRLPTMDDGPNLPCIRACVKESLRRMSIAPLGIPHAATRDDEYMGYTIHKGAAIVLNVC